MGINFQLHRGSAHLARGFREIQKASGSLADGNHKHCSQQFNNALEQFNEASNNFANAEEDAYAKAGKEIDKGNNELNQCVTAVANGKYDSATEHMDKALESYDDALALVS